MAPLKRPRLLAASALAALCAGAQGARAAEKLDGFWMDSDGEVILEVGPCGARRCAKVAWLKQPLGPDGQPLRDYRNPEPKLRSRPVCGLTIAKGFAKQPDGVWGDGTVYVPDLGESYSGYAEVLGPTKVRITGYIFLPIFGESEVWTKVSTPFRHCETGALHGETPVATDKAAVTAPAPKLVRKGRLAEPPER